MQIQQDMKTITAGVLWSARQRYLLKKVVFSGKAVHIVENILGLSHGGD